MRVITGISKGKRLKTPFGSDTRPTADAVKEAMFSSIQFEVEGAVVLDLFAGSGQLGVEALSRGAKFAHFADSDPTAVAAVKENLANTGLSGKANVSRLSYAAFLRTVKDGFDIAFIDPPYNRGIIPKVLDKLAPKMNRDGIIICEHERDLTLPKTVGGCKINKVYRHGSTDVTVYRNCDGADEGGIG